MVLFPDREFPGVVLAAAQPGDDVSGRDGTGSSACGGGSLGR